jgi:ribosomal protein S18 acetylase RimI-like enzyme
MNEPAITKIGVEDAAALQRLAKQTFADTFGPYNTEANMQQYLQENLSLDKLETELANPDSIFYFLRLDDQLIGYLKLNFANAQTELKDPRALEIERIYVIREYLGKKAGQLLYDLAVSIAQEKQLEYVWLAVWEQNKRAIRFYEKNGFIVFGQHTFCLGTDEQTDLMMKKELNTGLRSL